MFMCRNLMPPVDLLGHLPAAEGNWWRRSTWYRPASIGMGGGLRWPDSFVVQMERVTAAALLSRRAGCFDAKFVPFQPQAGASHYSAHSFKFGTVYVCMNLEGGLMRGYAYNFISHYLLGVSVQR